MQNNTEKQVRNQRTFKVGVIGASEATLSAIERIFAVTKFRARCYIAKAIDIRAFKKSLDVDCLMMCSANPHAVEAWENSTFSRQYGHPLIFLTRKAIESPAEFKLQSPVNPSRMIKMLDYYSIRVLNYLPEFEIGHDTHDIDPSVLTGLKILHQSHKKSGESELDQKRVLVVDDSLAVRRQMQIEFQLRDAVLDLVSTAEEAILAIKQRRYDLIFLDVVLPGMDGYTLCKKIKRSGSGNSTPVVLLTSRSSSFDKIKGALAGCDAYLVKPINHNEFEQVYQKFTELEVLRGQAHAS